MMFLKLLQFIYFSRINENFMLPIRSSADFISKQDIFYVKLLTNFFNIEFFGVNVIDSFFSAKARTKVERRNGRRKYGGDPIRCRRSFKHN